ncbi:MAG: UDP-glucose 4-epimerase [Amphiamblys sp. WSBS2006]|nr:MAG: UDP-glucose 4-epimerase [Amphiamblys sp. WSBS2006]
MLFPKTTNYRSVKVHAGTATIDDGETIDATQKKILVTGGAGYIGAHIAVELLQHGHPVVILDDLSNAKEETVERIGELAQKSPVFWRGDVTSEAELEKVFQKHVFWAVVHLAALKSVAHSEKTPLDYFHTNVSGTVALLRVMERHGCRRIVYSSSASVYGNTETVPIPHTQRRNPASCYGETKEMSERILEKLAACNAQWSVSILRYFNPGGAHPSGLIGEDPRGQPNNVLPCIAQAAVGESDGVTVFGTDYNTPDGTCVRDYIHVVDLAKGHLSALAYIEKRRGVSVHNLGSGEGRSVLELIKTFQKISGRVFSVEKGERRKGDVAVLVADPGKAGEDLGWTSRHSVEDICRDAFAWKKKNMSL